MEIDLDDSDSQAGRAHNSEHPLEASVGNVSPTTATWEAGRPSSPVAKKTPTSPPARMYLRATTESHQNRLKPEEKIDQFKVKEVRPDTGDPNETHVGILAGRRLYAHFNNTKHRLDKERETSWQKREQEELKECIFKPGISRYTSELISVSMYRPPHERFTAKDEHESDRRKIIQDRERREREEKEAAECTFAPVLCDASKRLAPKGRVARDELRAEAEAHISRSTSVSRNTTPNPISRTSPSRRSAEASRKPSPRTPTSPSTKTKKMTSPPRRRGNARGAVSPPVSIGERLYKDSAVSQYRSELLRKVVEHSERGGAGSSRLRKVSPSHVAKHASQMYSWGAQREELLETLRSEMDRRYFNASRITLVERDQMVRRLSASGSDAGDEAGRGGSRLRSREGSVTRGANIVEPTSPKGAPRVSLVSSQMAHSARSTRYLRLFEQLAGPVGELTVGALRGLVENAFNKQNGILAVFVHKPDEYTLRKDNFSEMCASFERRYGPQSWGRPEVSLDIPSFKPTLSQKSIQLAKANRSILEYVDSSSNPPSPLMTPTDQGIVRGSSVVGGDLEVGGGAPSATVAEANASIASQPAQSAAREAKRYSRTISPTCQRLYSLGLAQMQRRNSSAATHNKAKEKEEEELRSECTFAPRISARSRRIEASLRKRSSSSPSPHQRDVRRRSPKTNLVVEGAVERQPTKTTLRERSATEFVATAADVSVSPLSSGSSPQTAHRTPQDARVDRWGGIEVESDEDIVVQIDRVMLGVPSPQRARHLDPVQRQPLNGSSRSANGTVVGESAILSPKAFRRGGPKKLSSPNILRGSAPTVSANNSFESAVDMLTRAVYSHVSATNTPLRAHPKQRSSSSTLR